MNDHLKKIVDALVPIIKELSDLTEDIYIERYSIDEDGDEEIYFDGEEGADIKEREVRYRISPVEIAEALLNGTHDHYDRISYTAMDVENEKASDDYTESLLSEMKSEVFGITD